MRPGRYFLEDPLRPPMSVDIAKQLERANRYVEKGRIDDAIEAYQSILTAVPNHLESIQALGDLYTRQNQPALAAGYYANLFDKFNAPREEPKAIALYARFLKSTQQPPERVARYALLLQKQNRTEEAIEQFVSAALAFEFSGKADEALACFVRIAQLDPENRERHVAVAELAERSGNVAAASRGYLRAGQLTSDDEAEALQLFAQAHRLTPNDRSAALLYAQGLLRSGDAVGATGLLAPLAETEKDATFLETYVEALTRSGELDGARAALDQLLRQRILPLDRIAALSNQYLRSGAEDRAVEFLATVQKDMLAARRETEFTGVVDDLAAAYPEQVRLAEARCALYSELNREAKYFDALVHLFDLYLSNNQIPRACELFEKLVDIDPYDSRNQQRMDLLALRADPAFLARLKSRLMNAAPHGSQARTETLPQASASEPSPVLLEEVRAGQTLEDLLVQAEIFVQYSLQSKAIERLQRIAELFPEEATNNERLRSLFEAAHWWPHEGAAPQNAEVAEPQSAEAPARNAAYAQETLRDLGKISEINQNVFRQPSPRAMLSAAVNDVGNYMHLTRCLAIVGTASQPVQMASEFCAPGVEPSSGGHLVRLIAQIERAVPDELGGLPVTAAVAPALQEMGLETVLGVQLTDPETHAPTGMLIACLAQPHAWKPNETYFLQSIGDQMLLCVHHTRLRSLVRTLAVADEKTGLLARGSYIDCLLQESQRARTQGTPLTLALLQIDSGPEVVRQNGEATFERYMEQVGRAVQTIVRQTDLAVKYTSWALAFVLPDTPLAGARILAEKLRKMVSGLRPMSDGVHVTTSVAIAEAAARVDYDNEDVVTDLINRAETGLEQARSQGGNTVVSAEAIRN